MVIHLIIPSWILLLYLFFLLISSLNALYTFTKCTTHVDINHASESINGKQLWHLQNKSMQCYVATNWQHQNVICLLTLFSIWDLQLQQKQKQCRTKATSTACFYYEIVYRGTYCSWGCPGGGGEGRAFTIHCTTLY